MAAIVLGTVQFGLTYGISSVTKPSREEVFDILDLACQSGITTLDTADVYGDAQEMIGIYHKNRSCRFTVNTKFKGTDTVTATLDRALQTLGIDTIHTCFYHSFPEYITGQTLKETLAALKTAGKIRRIGVSLYTNDEMETALMDPCVDVIQLPFNLLDNRSRRGELIRRAKQNGKAIQVRSVFLQGLFFMDIGSLPAFFRPLRAALDEIQRISREYRIPVETLSLLYANAWDDIDEIIIGVDTKEQLARNLSALDTALPAGVIPLIDSIRVAETGLLYPYNWPNKVTGRS